jgi:hypothetical protein
VVSVHAADVFEEAVGVKAVAIELVNNQVAFSLELIFEGVMDFGFVFGVGDAAGLEDECFLAICVW